MNDISILINEVLMILNFCSFYSSGRRKREAKYAKVEVKQEPVINEETKYIPSDGDKIIDVSRPGVDQRYRTNHGEQVNFEYNFDYNKNEIKSEEEEPCREKDSTRFERSNQSTT